jgi:two-component system, OmpR family, response regulator CpxR
VLCVDADEDRMGRMVMVLDTWGYQAERAIDAAAAVEFISSLRPATIDALIVEAEMPGAENLIARARDIDSAMGTMLLGYDQKVACIPTQAHVFLPGILCRPAEIRERLKVLTARKRGPRKVSTLTRRMEAVA